MNHIKIKRKGKRLKCLALIFIVLSLICLILISNFSKFFINQIEMTSYEVPSNDENSSIAIPAKNSNTLKVKSNHSITFVFTPFSSSFTYLNRLYNITVRSWINSFPNSTFFIFGNKINYNDMNKIISRFTNNYEFITDIEEDEIGLMYVDDIFIKSIEKAKTDLICFIMQDTALVPDVSNKVNFLYEYFSQKKTQFAVLGRRCVSSYPPNGNTSYNLFMEELKNFDQLRNINAILNADYSNDFILFSLNNNKLDFSDIPPFLFGLYAWDTWIPGWMNEKIPIISLGNECSSYHIQHSKTMVSKIKVASNYELSQIHPKENLVYSDLKFHITNNTLYDEFHPIVSFEKR